jgi:hypothetical protein
LFLTTDLFARSANKYAILTDWLVMWAWKIRWPGFHAGAGSGDNRTVNQPVQRGIRLVIPGFHRIHLHFIPGTAQEGGILDQEQVRYE